MAKRKTKRRSTNGTAENAKMNSGEDLRGLYSQLSRNFNQRFPEWYECELPEYGQSNSGSHHVRSVRGKSRDDIMLHFAYQEEEWAAAIHTFAGIFANRGFTVEGGRNSVNSALRTIDSSFMPVNGYRRIGVRQLKFMTAMAYLITNFGALTYTNRREASANELPPVDCFIYADPTLANWWNGDSEKNSQDYPIIYDSNSDYLWKPTDFFHLQHSPDIRFMYAGMGHSPTEIAFNRMRVLWSLFQHTDKSLDPRMAKGFLTTNMTDLEISTAISNLDKFGVSILANDSEATGVDEKRLMPEINFMSLSRLPQFLQNSGDISKFVQIIRESYAAILQMDVRELWPVSGSSLGTSTETEVMHQKSSTKGLETLLEMWDTKMRESLPQSINFESDARDNNGLLETMEVTNKGMQVIKSLREAIPITTDEQALRLAVEDLNILPEWFLPGSDVQGDDTGVVRHARQKLKDEGKLFRMLNQKPFEPNDIYQYRLQQPIDKLICQPVMGGNCIVKQYQLWDSGNEALRRKSFPVAKVERALSDADLYEQKLNQIALLVESGQISEEEAELRIAALANAAILIYFLPGKRERVAGMTEAETALYNAAQSILHNGGLTVPAMSESQRGRFNTALGVVQDSDLLLEAFDLEDEQEIVADFVEIHDSSAVELVSFAVILSQLRDDPSISATQAEKTIKEKIKARVALWRRKIGEFRAAGVMYDPRNPLLQWVWSPPKDHCTDCIDFNGQIRTASEWREEYRTSGKRPRSNALECKGFNCGCRFNRVNSRLKKKEITSV